VERGIQGTNSKNACDAPQHVGSDRTHYFKPWCILVSKTKISHFVYSASVTCSIHATTDPFSFS
jgi:hypothetical protein